MKYNYRSGIEENKNKSKIWVLLPVFGFFVGSYALINFLAPSVTIPFGQPSNVTAQKLVHEKPAINQNRLYIPQINVDIDVVSGDSAAAMDRGAWHRKPENGDPKSGGNFVVTAPRFELQMTPTKTRAKSPFYHLDKVSEGDQIYVDFDGIRYAYSVTKKYTDATNITMIEQRTEKNILTLFSSDRNGEKIGNQVIEATAIGTIAWDNGSPKLKSL